MAKGKKRIVFLGPPNSGKGTQAVQLAREEDIPAISTGDMLRSAVASGSELGRQVDSILASGNLVGDDVMADLVRDRLSHDDAQEGFLLDGYPRTQPQAETLAEILDGQGAQLNAVVLIDAPDEVLVQRAINRGREDDKEEIVRKRLEVYREETAPLIEFYERQGLLRRVDGNQPIDVVAAAVLKAVAE